MVFYSKKLLVHAGILIPLFLGSPIWAQQTFKAAPAAPIPAPILNAKKAFVVNGGEDIADNSPAFSGGADRAYNAFYADLKQWGHYELVSAPADADLLITVRFSERYNVFKDIAPQFWVEIRDPKSNALLWTIIERVQHAVTQANRDKNFDRALENVVNEIKRISTSGTPSENGGTAPASTN